MLVLLLMQESPKHRASTQFSLRLRKSFVLFAAAAAVAEQLSWFLYKNTATNRTLYLKIYLEVGNWNLEFIKL